MPRTRGTIPPPHRFQREADAIAEAWCNLLSPGALGGENQNIAIWREKIVPLDVQVPVMQAVTACALEKLGSYEIDLGTIDDVFRVMETVFDSAPGGDAKDRPALREWFKHTRGGGSVVALAKEIFIDQDDVDILSAAKAAFAAAAGDFEAAARLLARTKSDHFSRALNP